jgi:hypothetical protein
VGSRRHKIARRLGRRHRRCRRECHHGGERRNYGCRTKE